MGVVGEVVLELSCEGCRGWRVDSKWIKNPTSCLVLQGQGWIRFAAQNNLREGNIVAFTYVGEKRFRVQLFGPTMESLLTRCPCYTDRPQGTQWKKKSSTESMEIKTPMDIPPFRGKSTPIQKNTSIEKENGFKSIHPVVRKIIIQSHVSGSFRLFMPKKFVVEHLSRERIPIFLVNHETQKWKVELIGNATDPYLKPADWCAFAKANNIRKGNTCIFELIDKSPWTLKVHVM